ncbi:MAG TPA: DUF2891 domain-containing protein [Allosphingosinicella sp.]|jgi:hypothetical protein
MTEHTGVPSALTPDIAARFAEIALGHVRQEYPHKLDHVMDGPEDVAGPAELHPIFHGSFDWHSCVHGYWLLMRVRRLFPELAVRARIDALFEEMLTPEKVAGERDYLDRAYAGGFERPYGWAWLLALHLEAQRQEEGHWADALAPLAEAFAARFRAFLPKLTYPIRTGTHFNTAFALILALEWADANGDDELGELIHHRAADYFGTDRDCQAWEPGGDEFLSPALTEALLMSRVWPEESFAPWLAVFLPRLDEGYPRTLFTPAFVSDRSDGKIAHLDGLNLSRAWCWRALGRRDAAQVHLDASLPYVAGDYMGEHWLATFALLALGEEGEASSPAR